MRVMNNKQERQRLISELVRKHQVTSQDMLSSLMEQRGFRVAQATLSRDVRELKISKVQDAEGFYYRLSSPSEGARPSGQAGRSDSIESVEFSWPLAVVRPRPGHAGMVAAILDGMKFREVMGTIAGDDTILVILRTGFSQEGVEASLEKVFPGSTARE